MTGYDLYKKVCSVLGYYNIDEGNMPLKAEAMTDIINQICSDLKVSSITRLTDELPVDPKVSEALLYGCAMLLSVSLKDGSCSGFYSELYNSKRAMALSGSDRRFDVLPTPHGGS